VQKFAIESRVSEGMITYHVSGYVNEEALFPQTAFAPTVRIVLKDVTGLNSVGTRLWCEWIKTIKPPTLIRIDDCPSIFIKCFNQVLGSCPQNMTVFSFFVPFYSTEQRKRFSCLYVRDSHYDFNGNILAPEQIQVEGVTYEIDVQPEYFRFLKK
jgi:hypothetical protein